MAARNQTPLLCLQREEDPDTYSNFYYTVGHNDVAYFMLVSCSNPALAAPCRKLLPL